MTTNICEKCGERLVDCVCAVDGHVVRPPKFTSDQWTVLRTLRYGALYEGAFPLYTDLSERRAAEVRRQLEARGLVERSPFRSRCWRITPAGLAAYESAYKQRGSS